MSNWKRARNEEQIEERVNAVLDAAGRVFQKHPYEEVTMLMIAKEASFTRSNIYRYFKTREEIFLSLFLLDVEKWAREVNSSFSTKMKLEEFVDHWTEILCKHNRLLELSPLLNTSLEKNTSEEVYRKTKLTLNRQMEEIASSAQKALPFLTEKDAMMFVATNQVILAGAWPMGQHTKMQEKVLKELAMPHLKIDFVSFFKNTILTYLKGLERNQE